MMNLYGFWAVLAFASAMAFFMFPDKGHPISLWHLPAGVLIGHVAALCTGFTMAFVVWKRSGFIFNRLELFGIRLIKESLLGAPTPGAYWFNGYYNPPNPAKLAAMAAKPYPGWGWAAATGVGLLICVALYGSRPPSSLVTTGLITFVFFISVYPIQYKFGASMAEYRSLVESTQTLDPEFIAACRFSILDIERMRMRPRDFPDEFLEQVEHENSRRTRLWVEATRDLDRGDKSAAVTKICEAYEMVRDSACRQFEPLAIRVLYALDVCAPRMDWANFDEATHGIQDMSPSNYLHGILGATKEYTWGNREKGLTLARATFDRQMFCYEHGNPHRDYIVDRMKESFPELADEFERKR
jgi:hypothetical protein